MSPGKPNNHPTKMARYYWIISIIAWSLSHGNNRIAENRCGAGRVELIMAKMTRSIEAQILLYLGAYVRSELQAVSHVAVASNDKDKARSDK